MRDESKKRKAGDCRNERTCKAGRPSAWPLGACIRHKVASVSARSGGRPLRERGHGGLQVSRCLRTLMTMGWSDMMSFISRKLNEDQTMADTRYLGSEGREVELNAVFGA